MDTIEKTVAALGQTRRLAWVVSILHLCLYAVALLIYFLAGWQAALVLLAGNVLIYLLGVRRCMARHRREVTAASLRFGLGDGLADFRYRDKGGLSRDACAAWSIIPLMEGELSVMSRHFFSGAAGALSLAGCELTLHYAVPGGKRDYRFFSGAFLTAGTPAQGGWLLLGRGLVESSALADFLAEQDYHPCPESPAEGYALYAQGTAAPLPMESARQVAALCGKVPALSLLRLTQTGAAVFLNGRFYTGARYPSARLTADQLRANPLPERDELWKFFRFWAKTNP